MGNLHHARLRLGLCSLVQPTVANPLLQVVAEPSTSEDSEEEELPGHPLDPKGGRKARRNHGFLFLLLDSTAKSAVAPLK